MQLFLELDNFCTNGDKVIHVEIEDQAGSFLDVALFVRFRKGPERLRYAIAKKGQLSAVCRGAVFLFGERVSVCEKLRGYCRAKSGLPQNDHVGYCRPLRQILR